jgi:hypothetical protein
MTHNEVTYFKCGHKTIWGVIYPGVKLRNKSGDVIFCRDCDTWRKVKKTVREKA